MTDTISEPATVCATRRWVVDPARSRVEFEVRTFWGVSTVRGRFDRFEGSYSLDDEDVPTIELVIDAGSLDTGNPTRDEHLRGNRFFAVDAHPQVRFTSTLIGEAGELVAVTGHLEAAGHRVPTALDATVREVGSQLEVETTTSVDQRELGMTASPLGMIRTPATLHVKARLTPA